MNGQSIFIAIEAYELSKTIPKGFTIENHASIQGVTNIPRRNCETASMK